MRGALGAGTEASGVACRGYLPPACELLQPSSSEIVGSLAALTRSYFNFSTRVNRVTLGVVISTVTCLYFPKMTAD